MNDPGRWCAIFLLGCLVFAGFGVFADDSDWQDDPTLVIESGLCTGHGPQTPRRIDMPEGGNTVRFPPAPAAEHMNLCNIHFHEPAEHKSADFNVAATEDDRGWTCNSAANLSAEVLRPFEGNQCAGVKPGDTIEVHWVFTSCPTGPGPGLASCSTESCANPSLRVETQVFTLVNDDSALDFRRYDVAPHEAGHYYRPNHLPMGTGTPVEFAGSTTGPSFDEQTCSPLKVTWRVRPMCAELSIQGLSAWCADNVFKENHAHGVRPLVRSLDLLSPID